MTDATPPFDSYIDALIFAFNASSENYDRPYMNRVAAPAVGSGRGLGGLDGAAQAGMIRAEVRDLGRMREAILLARFAPRWIDCSCRAPCCSGRKPNQEWVDAIAHLAEYTRSAVLSDCSTTGLMRREYVVRFFSDRKERDSLEAIAARHGKVRNTIGDHFSRVAHHFGRPPAKSGKDQAPGLEDIARARIDEVLRTLKIVSS